MRRELLAAALAAASMGCGSTAPGEAISWVRGGFEDVDRDWLDDRLEQELANRHAPVAYLALDMDWTLPASVDWYLPRVTMRFHHNNCPDHEILPFGSVTQDALVSQSHQRMVLGLLGCSHEDPVQYSNGSWHPDDHFFLQQHDSTHPGASDPSDWILYAHVYQNDLGGVTVQYWYFWSYNDGFSVQNHEGDWEGLEVRLGPSGEVVQVGLNQHNGRTWYAPSQMQWYGETHPVVWVADGSHATYASKGECDDAEWYYVDAQLTSCSTIAANRWFTWAGGLPAGAEGRQGGGVMNLGEKAFPMPGASFIQYSGRWGEEGLFDGTSGPRGPAYKDDWLGGVASCGGTCGGESAAGCWCDAACALARDCCADACQACGVCPPETGHVNAGNGVGGLFVPPPGALCSALAHLPHHGGPRDPPGLSCGPGALRRRGR